MSILSLCRPTCFLLAGLLLGLTLPASADPYAVIRTISYTESGSLWDSAGDDLRPFLALGPDHFVAATKGRRDSGGAAYVFAASDGSFLRRLTASDASVGMEFGASLAVDGGFALIGAPNKFLSATSRGKAYLYNLATGVEILTFAETDGDTNGDQFGSSVALDGTVAVIGAPGAGLQAAMPIQANRGFAYVFNTATGARLHTLAASDWAFNDNFGSAVAVKGDDVLIGAPDVDYNGGVTYGGGKAYVYDLTTGAERFILSNPTPAINDYFGLRVSITDDYFVVASPNDDDVTAGSGSIYLFNRSTGAFVRKVLANPSSGGGAFGLRHSVSGEVLLERQDYDGTSFGFYDLATGSRTELVSDPTVYGIPAWRGNILLVGRATTDAPDGFTPADGIFTIKVLSNVAAPPIVTPRNPQVGVTGKTKLTVKKPKVTLRGLASDLDGDLAGVEVKVGKKPYRRARGGASWSLNVTGLKKGTNILLVRSVDAAGNTSPTVKLTVVLK